MSTTTSMPIVERFKAQLANVSDRAAEQHSDQLRRYVAGVRRLAEAGCQLPTQEADDLLKLASDLGVSPDRLGYDADLLIHEANLRGRIESTNARNAEQRAPLQGLESAVKAAEADYLAVRREYAVKLQAAEAAVNDARRARDAVVSLRDEPTGHWEKQARRLKDLSPHLYVENMPEAEFRRVMARPMVGILAGG